MNSDADATLSAGVERETSRLAAARTTGLAKAPMVARPRVTRDGESMVMGRNLGAAGLRLGFFRPRRPVLFIPHSTRDPAEELQMNCRGIDSQPMVFEVHRHHLYAWQCRIVWGEPPIGVALEPIRVALTRLGNMYNVWSPQDC